VESRIVFLVKRPSIGAVGEKRSIRLLLSLTVVAALLGCSTAMTSSPGADSQSAPASPSSSRFIASVSQTPTVDPRQQPAPSPDQEHLAFSDYAADTYLWINLDPESTFKGRFAFAVGSRGLYWGDGPADFTSQPDGSVEVSYDGPGWNDPAGTFEPLLWRSETHGDPSPVPLGVDGVVGVDRSTASVELFADGQVYELNDGPPIAGADAAIAQIAALVEAEDWPALHLRIHRSIRASIDEAEFMSRMTSGMLAYGSITSATVTSGANVSDSGLGWDFATAGLDITFSMDGRSATYPVTVVLMADADGWWLSSISQINPNPSPMISATAAP
jgi:hypothetical protein